MHGLHDALDKRMHIQVLPLVFDAPGPRQPQQGIDDVAQPLDRGLDEVDGLAGVALEQAGGPVAGGGGEVAARQQGAHLAQGQGQLLAEALEVHQRRTQVMGDAIDERLVFLVLVTELAVAFQQLGCALADADFQIVIEAADRVLSLLAFAQIAGQLREAAQLAGFIAQGRDDDIPPVF